MSDVAGGRPVNRKRGAGDAVVRESKRFSGVSGARSTMVVSRLDNIRTEGNLSSFEIQTDVPRNVVIWRTTKCTGPSGVTVETHTVTGLKVNRQSAFDDFKHVPSGCPGVFSYLKDSPGYASNSVDPRAASTAHLNMAHLVPGSRFLIPKHELTTVFTSPGYNQVTMVAEEEKLYEWLDKNKITDVDCTVEVERIPADKKNVEFKKVVADILSSSGKENADNIKRNCLAYTRSIGLPIVKSYRAVYTDKADPSKQFEITIGADTTFALSRAHVYGPKSVTPAHKRYESRVAPESAQKAFRLAGAPSTFPLELPIPSFCLGTS